MCPDWIEWILILNFGKLRKKNMIFIDSCKNVNNDLKLIVCPFISLSLKSFGKFIWFSTQSAYQNVNQLKVFFFCYFCFFHFNDCYLWFAYLQKKKRKKNIWLVLIMVKRYLYHLILASGNLCKQFHHFNQNESSTEKRSIYLFEFFFSFHFNWIQF